VAKSTQKCDFAQDETGCGVHVSFLRELEKSKNVNRKTGGWHGKLGAVGRLEKGNSLAGRKVKKVVRLGSSLTIGS
jgi:hypothetical protein